MTEPIDRLKAALAGRYAIERELGRGGMAVVYLARDERHGRPVAIKVMRADIGEAMNQERFRREIEVAASLSHPNILPLHDSGEADGVHYFVMPFVEGESLRDRLKREGTLSLDEASRIVREIGEALAYAHERGLVHRDIKPENILFQAGQAVVCDFGIAKMTMEAEDHLTGTGVSVGTFAYMSPEQISGGSEIDGRSDVFSLGCVLHEMLEGAPPFTGDTPHAALARKLMGTLPEPVRTDLPSTVREVMAEALATDVNNRTPSAAELVEGLARAQTERAIDQRRREKQRHTLLRAVGAVVGLALLGAGGMWLADRATASPFQVLAVVPEVEGTEADAFVREVYRDLSVELNKAGVRVKSPDAVVPYLDAPSIPVIASDLGVDGVVTVDATLRGTAIESSVTLVDAETLDFVWSRDFTGDETRFLQFLGEMTTAVAAELGVSVSRELRDRYASAEPVDPAVLDALRKADFHWEQLTEESLATALSYYELARDRDPNSAEAWNGIAQVSLLRAQQNLISSEEARRVAEPALQRAIELDPTLAQAQATLAIRKTWSEWAWEEARAAFEAALEQDPLDATTRAYHSLLLLYLGEPEASLQHAERARRDDPLNGLIAGLYAQNLNARGRSADARDAILEALRFENSVPFLLATLRTSYHLTGQWDEAIDSWRASYTAQGSYRADAVDDEEALAIIAGYQGGEESYREVLRGLAELMRARAEESYVSPWSIGTMYARAGMADEAIEFLSEAVDQRNQNSPYLAVEDTFDFLRDDPRFQAMIDVMGLPPKQTGPGPVTDGARP